MLLTVARERCGGKRANGTLGCPVCPYGFRHQQRSKISDRGFLIGCLPGEPFYPTTQQNYAAPPAWLDVMAAEQGVGIPAHACRLTGPGTSNKGLAGAQKRRPGVAADGFGGRHAPEPGNAL